MNIENEVIQVNGTGATAKNIWSFAGYSVKKNKNKKADEKQDDDGIPVAFNIPHSEVSNIQGDEKPVSEKVLGMNKKLVTAILIVALPTALVGLYFGGKYAIKYIKKLKK